MSRKRTKKKNAKKAKVMAKKTVVKKTKLTPKPRKAKLTKRDILDNLSTGLDDSGLLPPEAKAHKIVAQVLEDLALLIENCVKPGGLGNFMLPGVVKFTTKERPAIKKGTMVRRPGTSEMMPSKGRPSSMRVKATPLARIKKAAQS
jgi:hypothetical protein